MTSWCDQLPRPIYETLDRVAVSDDWFEVYQVADWVFAIYEPHQFQEVISYLIVGRSGALLLDTGMGIGQISRVVNELTSLPITVLNTHTHFDHIGGNAEFSTILGMGTDFTKGNQAGVAHEEVADQVQSEALCRPLPVGVEASQYGIRPFRVTQWITDGHRIDLGDRALEVVAIPGHTPDSIAVVEKATGLLFVGDSFYEGPIYLFVADTDLDAYRESVDRLAQMVPDLKQLLPSHNTPLTYAARLLELKGALESVASGQVRGTPREGERIEYSFNGFSLLMAADKTRALRK